MQINNYVWENDLSLNDLLLKQKEKIERLKSNEKTLANLLDKEQKKNKKAIEYIKENCYDYDYETYSSLTTDEVIELLDILKGEDEE